MKDNRMISTPHRDKGQISADYLRQEIAFFEARLKEMGETGDCAYERALSKTYRIFLQQRRGQLAQLYV